MASLPSNKLYSPNLLALSTQLADFPLDKNFAYRASGRSRTCGSTIEIGVDLSADGRIAQIGMQVSACAIGQSSAAIMAIGAKGRLPDELTATKDAIRNWLSSNIAEEYPMPEWPQFEALKPAWEHKGRHGALLMAWTAMTQALSTDPTSR